MNAIIETERLLIREMNDDDFPALKAILSDPENMKYYPQPYDDNGVWRWINWCKDCYQRYGFGLWAVILKETGEMIGDCGISMQNIDEEEKPEIGYHLRIDCHQKGIGKEMAQAVKDYFFTHFDFDEVYSYMVDDNLPSYKLAESNGMTFRHLFTTKSGEVCRVYSIKREEWEKDKIVTDRLILRKIKEKDALAMYKNWCSDPEVAKYTVWTAHENIEVTKQLVDLWLKEEKDHKTIRFMITLKGNDEPIGGIDVVGYRDDFPEVGYCLSRKYWNKGYMSEACKAIINHLFDLGFKKILIRADERNLASNRVIEKCGFIFTHKEKIEDEIKPVTVNWYEKTK